MEEVYKEAACFTVDKYHLSKLKEDEAVKKFIIDDLSKRVAEHLADILSSEGKVCDLVEVKRGKWIVDEDGNIECSVCGHHGVGDLYCERCGAKMDKECSADE